jgi:hypothetical protein
MLLFLFYQIKKDFSIQICCQEVYDYCNGGSIATNEQVLPMVGK